MFHVFRGAHRFAPEACAHSASSSADTRDGKRTAWVVAPVVTSRHGRCPGCTDSSPPRISWIPARQTRYLPRGRSASTPERCEAGASRPWLGGAAENDRPSSGGRAAGRSAGREHRQGRLNSLMGSPRRRRWRPRSLRPQCGPSGTRQSVCAGQATSAVRTTTSRPRTLVRPAVLHFHDHPQSADSPHEPPSRSRWRLVRFRQRPARGAARATRRNGRRSRRPRPWASSTTPRSTRRPSMSSSLTCSPSPSSSGPTAGTGLAAAASSRLHVMGYTLGRTRVGMLSIDPLQKSDVLGLRLNVWTSIMPFVGAAAYPNSERCGIKPGALQHRDRSPAASRVSSFPVADP